MLLMLRAIETNDKYAAVRYTATNEEGFMATVKTV
jgi:hypothetical protein